MELSSQHFKLTECVPFLIDANKPLTWDGMFKKNIAVIDKIHWLPSATTSQSHVSELLDTVHLSAVGRHCMD